MDRWATKDHYELEEEEANRLVRPAPKVKPPRRDRMREDMNPDRDLDVDDDPDVAKDPDLSMNYKSIGGSALNVLATFIMRRADAGLIKVRHKDTGRVVQIKPETLKSSPDKYEEVADDAEEEAPESPMDAFKRLPPGTIEKPQDRKKEPKSEPAKEEKPEPAKNEKPEPAPAKDKGEKDDEFYQGAGRELYDAAETDLPLKSMLQSLRDPKSEIAGFAAHAPQMPVAPFLRGKKAPEGIETLGDLQKAALHGAKAPEKGKKPKKKPETPAAEPPKGEAPAKEEKPSPGETKPEAGKELPKGEAPAKEEKPEAGKEKPKGKEDPAKAVVDRFLEEAKNKPELEKDWTGYVDSLPTTTRNAEGKPVWFDPKTGQEQTWEQLPLEHRAQLVSTFEKKHKGDALAALTAKNLEGNDEAREAVESMFNPDSEIARKISKLRKEGHDPNALPIKKNLPELAGVVPESVKTVGDFQRLVEGHADLFKKKTPLQAWEKSGGPKSDDFAAYARNIGGVEKDGVLQFPSIDPETGKTSKKTIPWDHLSGDQKAQLHDDFQKAQSAAKWTEGLTEAARGDLDLAHALYQLGNPRSPAAQKLARVTDINDPLIDTYLPSLRNLSFPPGATLQDVVETAKRAFKPMPPPKRRPASADEVKASEMALRESFKKYPVFSAQVRLLDLHPEDAEQVLGTYQRLKSAKMKPEELEQWVKDARKQGLYTTDPSAVLPPKAGLDKNGAKKSWSDLTPEEQANAYASHRNQVIATTMAMRDMVNQSFQEMGVPKQFADTLALAKLSRVPGETQTQRALRARPIADKVFDHVLEANAEPVPFEGEDFQRVLDTLGDDPLARRMAVANFQANNYLSARQRFLDPSSPQHIDERDPARNIAARLREATTMLRRMDEEYPYELRTGSMAEMFRRRVMSRLMALDPEKAAQIQPETQKMDADDWDANKEARDTALKTWKKQHAEYKKAEEEATREFEAERTKKQAEGDPYRPIPIKSVKDRLAEVGVSEPIPPDPLPPKPAGYDLVRKTPRGQQQSGQSLWRKLFKGLTASERVAERFRVYSSCAPGGAMGSNPTDRRASTDRTGVYWGVDPATKEKVVNLPHTPWQQAHARDLGDKDYNAILASAREWMKVPVLARVLDEKDSLGAVRDIQLRAALDLAIRDMDGGKYAVGLHPTVYNNLLAQLGGKSEKETLLTIRQASDSLYTQATGEDPSMKAAAEIRKFAAEIAAQHPGLAFDLTNLAFRVAEQEDKEQGQGDDKKPDFLKDKDAASKYAAVKSAVIKTAAQNPAVRPALLPVLRMLKG